MTNKQSGDINTMPTPALTPAARALAASTAMRTAFAISRSMNAKNKKKNQPKGGDIVDRALMGAVKVGLFAMFGLFLASKTEKRFPGTLNRMLPPTPNRPRPKPMKKFP